MRIELSTMRTISSSGLGHVYRRSSMGAAMRRMVERKSCFGALQGCKDRIMWNTGIQLYSIVFHLTPRNLIHEYNGIRIWNTVFTI